MSNVYNKSRLNTPFPLTPLRDRLLMTNQTLWRSPMTTHFMHHSDADIAPPDGWEDRTNSGARG